MSRFVSGARVPNGPILANIAKTLGVTTDYLVGKSDKTEGWTGNWIPCEKGNAGRKRRRTPVRD